MTDLHDAYFALGSNIEPARNMRAAIAALRGLGELVAVSRAYETTAIGNANDPRFLNLVAHVRTDLSPDRLLDQVRAIERELGRVRGGDPNAARTIDIDLLVYDDLVGAVGGRNLPSAEIFARPFVAIPLAEVAPTLRIPGTGRLAGKIAAEMITGPPDMILLPELTEEFQLMTERADEHGQIESAVSAILTAIGEDPARDGLLRTPERIARMYFELTEGYHLDAEALINDALFEVEYDEMVLVKDIEYYSLCEHHLLPFFGRAHVAYLPKGRVIGLSKIPRVVDMFARRLQVQERMTSEIADFVDDVIAPSGVAVVVEGLHLCAAMRGVQKPGAVMVTSAMRGSFRDNAKTRAELLSHLSRDRSIAL